MEAAFGQLCERSGGGTVLEIPDSEKPTAYPQKVATWHTLRILEEEYFS